MIDYVRRFVLPAAYSILPTSMGSEQATAMLLAIGWQESRLEKRRQVGGPARGLWQFESGGGVVGVLKHAKTREHARTALRRLGYPHEPTPHGVHLALEHNDVLAAIWARLLLWTVPGALPKVTESALGWFQYESGWRPGKPKPESWAQAWAVGWNQ